MMGTQKQITVDEVKKVQVDILRKILTCCKENSIQVFLAYGSLIGAVRHQGFIPWDDDIDLIMKRKDCEKFTNTFKDEEGLVVEKHGLGDETDVPTRIAVSDARVERYEYGNNVGNVNVHIFPLDLAPTSSFMKKRIMFIELAYKVKNIVWRPGRSLSKNIKLFFLKVAVLPFSKKYLATSYEKLLKNKIGKKDKYIIPMDPYFGYQEYDAVIFSTALEMSFENLIAPVPFGYDALLTCIYGDYMTPPPKEQQIPHDGYEYFLNVEEDS